MKRILIIIFSGCLAAGCIAAQSLAGELNYTARYHLGPIKVCAGAACIKYDIDGNSLHATFDGRSIPWDGRIYCINDTLDASMTPAAETVSYSNGWYTKPFETEFISGRNFGRDQNAAFKNTAGYGSLDAGDATMEAVAISTDMLGLLYYFHTFDFASLPDGHRTVIPVTLPGGETQQVAVRYDGTDTFNGRPTYKVTFEYSYNGAMSNYPVTCQIDRTSRKPMLFSADIKIGHVELILDN